MSIHVHNKERKVYIVMGMAHSATSFISKLLEDGGVDMHNNMEGLYQDFEFWSTNIRILKEAGGSWNKPPSEKKILATNQDKRIKRKIRKRRSKKWGFKDPRTSLTIRKFLPHLKGDVYLICCFRKPSKIIESFSKNKNIDKKVIDKYNRAIIRGIKDFVEL